MKDLKITFTNGNAEVQGLSIGIGAKTLVIAHGDLLENIEETSLTLEVFADAHNTYQATGMTASELAKQAQLNKEAAVLAHNMIDNLEKQRDELLEALKVLAKSHERLCMNMEMYGDKDNYKGWFKQFFKKDIECREAAIQSVEQKQS